MVKQKTPVALVTGGAKGIGREIVEMLTKEGIKVIVLDKADLSSMTRPELIDFRKCDLSVFDEVKRTVQEILRDYATLDYLVNNAGIQFVESLENLDFGHWDVVLTVNLKIPAFLIHSFSPRMKSGAHILNISSIHSRVSRLNKYAYDASKAGLASLTRESALALAEKGIRVNSISPGAVNTPMNDGFADPAMLRETLAKIPMKTIIQPEEIADLARYLLLVSKSVTGSDFAVDGGRSLPL